MKKKSHVSTSVAPTLLAAAVRRVLICARIVGADRPYFTHSRSGTGCPQSIAQAAGAAVATVMTIISAMGAGSAVAQTAAANGDKKEELTEIVVTGIRAAFESAEKRKQDAAQIQESITAEDIGKMPDNNVAESLQRVTGVQVNRDLGEGQYVAIRGLTQVQSELNGRPVFSADGNGRTLNYESVPSALLANVDVFKSPMADQVDGGVGGLINFRTRRPFDFDGLKLAGSIDDQYGDQIKHTALSGSALVSDRWSTPAGDFGALISVNDQNRDFFRRFNTNASFVPGTFVNAQGQNLFPGKTCENPGSAPGTVCYSEADYAQPNQGHRNRIGTNISLEWQPNPDLLIYSDIIGTDFRDNQTVLGSFPCQACDSQQVVSNVTFIPGSPNDVRSADWSKVLVINDNYYQSVYARDREAALGAEWNRGRLSWDIDGDVAKTTSSTNFLLLEQQATVPDLFYDVGTQPTTLKFPGFDTANPANWVYTRLSWQPQLDQGTEKAIKWDVKYETDGWLTSVKFGMRWAQDNHQANSNNTSQSIANVPLASVPISLSVSPSTQIFPSLPTPWIAPDIGQLNPTNANHLYAVFGFAPPPSYDPHNYFAIDERTVAGYIMANFKGTAIVPFSGNIGVRYVTTDDKDIGWAATTSAGVTTYAPYGSSSHYSNVLPALNLKFDITNQLFARFAASQVVTRPDFPSLNPTITLNPFFGTASAGNPNLKPLEARQLDSSLEWYFSKSGYVYGSVFYKDIHNFQFTSETSQVFNGLTYLTTHPENGQKGTILGEEIGYQQFFSSLPHPFDGLGAVLNTTILQPKTPAGASGLDAPLPQLSKRSYNAIGMYEMGPYSMRVAYNWRDTFIESIIGSTGNVQANYRKPYGILDMSASYKISSHATATFSAQNLTQPLRATYYSIPQYTEETQREDRYFSLGVRFSY